MFAIRCLFALCLLILPGVGQATLFEFGSLEPVAAPSPFEAITQAVEAPAVQAEELVTVVEYETVCVNGQCFRRPVVKTIRKVGGATKSVVETTKSVVQSTKTVVSDVVQVPLNTVLRVREARPARTVVRRCATRIRGMVRCLFGRR